MADSLDLIVQVNREGEINWLSDTVEKILGHHTEELLGTKIEELLRPDNVLSRTQLRDGVTSANASTFRVEFRNHEGDYFWFSAVSRQLFDTQGVSNGAVIGFHLIDDGVEREEVALRTDVHHEFLVNFSKDVVCVEDQGVIVWVSPHMKTLLNFEGDDLLGRSVAELVHPDDRGSLANLSSVLDSDEPVTLTLRISKADGTHRWVAMKAYEVVDNASRATLRVSSFCDAQAEVAARHALLVSERRYRLLAENSTDVVIECDEEGIVNWLSPSAQTVLGWRSDTIVGQQLLQFVLDTDQTRHLAQLSDVGSNRRALAVDVRYLTSTRETKWMEQLIRRFRGKESREYIYIMTLRDIDEQVALRTLVDETRAHFELLAQGTRGVVYAADLEGQLLWVSPSVVRELGWQVGDILGHDVLELTFDEDRPRVTAWRQLLHFGEVLESLTIRVRHASGHFVWVKVRAQPTRDREGRVTGVMVAFHNVDGEVSNLRALRTVSAVGRILVREKEPHEMLREICEVAVVDGGYALSWFARRNFDEEKTVDVVVASAEHASYLENIKISWGSQDEGQGPTGRAIRLGQSITVADVDDDKAFEPWRKRAHAHGFRSFAAIPVVVNAEIVVTWQLCAKERGAFIPDVLSVLEELAIDIGFALSGTDSAMSLRRGPNL
ncbi:MAG: PAS domain S-box protein [Acidimicrobiaceae bacterium]|nr:PAS domain S-box protein [Acidimicrobiaceae bacterium]